jgi:hypothetical protein
MQQFYIKNCNTNAAYISIFITEKDKVLHISAYFGSYPTDKSFNKNKTSAILLCELLKITIINLFKLHTVQVTEYKT